MQRKITYFISYTEIYSPLFSFFNDKTRNFALLYVQQFMILKKISILNFKNIREASLTLSPKMNCFIGHNGEGKTNLLDAVYYLSFCRSAFTTIDSQVIMHDQDFFVIDGTYERENGDEMSIYCGMKRGTKKHVKRDKKEYQRLSQHLGLIPLIFVSPSDSMIVGGGSEERRRLMDVVIAQYDHVYIEALTNYNKALQQRNTLLKLETEPDPVLLSLWEEQMARQGETVFKARTAFIDEFIPVFQRIYDDISERHEEVSLAYVSHAQRGPLLDVIQRDRVRDRAVGYSLHGIHRDDLELTLNGYPMKRIGSQGQNKTLTLALKLSQFALLRQTTSRTQPLLLLDDVFDKLDAQRVEAVVELVSGSDYGQIFMTDTNREHIDQILRHSHQPYKIFNVSDGDITESEVRHV